jgi:hypothetical protein
LTGSFAIIHDGCIAAIALDGENQKAAILGRAFQN